MDQYIGKMLDNRYEILRTSSAAAAWPTSTRSSATA